MKILLDTHLLLWAAGDPKRLSASARKLIGSRDNRLHFSAASLWEIAIKNGLGRADFSVDARQLRMGLLNNDYAELEISGEHALAVEALPLLHKDPFDRMLLAQAKTEGMTLLTSDRTLAQYAGVVKKV